MFPLWFPVDSGLVLERLPGVGTMMRTISWTFLGTSPHKKRRLHPPLPLSVLW